jgi:hypothetical protein
MNTMGFTGRSTFHKRFITGAVAALLITVLAPLGFAKRSRQDRFSSPEQAAQALYTAAKQDNDEALMRILGAGKELVALEDRGRDKHEREEFVTKFQEMHRLVVEPDHMTVLYVGAENWPFPVPLVSKKGTWYFDAQAGAAEISYRRIGENEEAAIESCELLAGAEEQFFRSSHNDDPTNHYSLRFVSSHSGQDGLYSGPNSVIPDFLANAGVSSDPSDPMATPYAGYYFLILTQQGKDAVGGPKDYVKDGKLIGGFAFVAYPAEYGTSGVMTFIVNQDNRVYQKDLGPNTAKIVKAMTRYNPDAGWRDIE